MALSGITVLDISRLLPGPLCTQFLTRLGATVIKLEGPGSQSGIAQNDSPINKSGKSAVLRGDDYVRYLQPTVKVKTNHNKLKEHGSLFETLNSGKKGLYIDIKHENGPAVVHKLIKNIDVVVTGAKPNSLNKFSLDYDSLKQHNRGLIYCNLSGYGSFGPLMNKAGHDLNYQAYSGLLCDDWSMAGYQPADGSGAMQAVIGILAGLLQRTKTGEGQFIDISLCEAAINMNIVGISNEIARSTLCDSSSNNNSNNILDGSQANYRVYKTGTEGEKIAVGALEYTFYSKVYNILGLNDLDTKPIDAQHEILETLFMSKPSDYWISLFKDHNVCVDKVLSLKEVINHPQHVDRGVFITNSDSKSSEESSSGVVQVVLGPTCSARNSQHFEPAPSVGEHSRQVLTQLGELSTNEINQLILSGVVGES